MCTFKRQPYFKPKPHAELLLKTLHEESADHSFLVRADCLMPDHLHWLPQAFPSSLRFVKACKHSTSRRFTIGNQKTLWQLAFYDQILRGEEAPGNVAAYTRRYRPTTERGT
jgi:REP element-mobilizing transposase RayT